MIGEKFDPEPIVEVPTQSDVALKPEVAAPKPEVAAPKPKILKIPERDGMKMPDVVAVKGGDNASFELRTSPPSGRQGASIDHSGAKTDGYNNTTQECANACRDLETCNAFAISGDREGGMKCQFRTASTFVGGEWTSFDMVR